MEGDITARMGNLVIQIGVLLFAVRFFGFLAKKARISSVLGELIAGVVIGPYALGAIPLPGFPSGIFSLNSVSLAVTPELYGFSTVASVILLFASGLETDLALFTCWRRNWSWRSCCFVPFGRCCRNDGFWLRNNGCKMPFPWNYVHRYFCRNYGAHFV